MKQENLSVISTIKQIQNDFLKEILNQKEHAMVQYIHQNQIDPGFRLSIYRNNIMQNLRHALESTFPNTWKLVGKECADKLAYCFCQKPENLPKSHCLDDWGDKFPQFLEEIEALKDLVYLKDIAELEWLKHKSYGAAHFKALNPLQLQNYLNKYIKKLYLMFNPSVFLFSSTYFLRDIIDLIENPDDKTKVILQKKPSYAVINRQATYVVTHWISEEQYCFFNSIKNGLSLMESFEIVLKTNPDFDLVASIQLLLKNDLLWKYKYCCRKRLVYGRNDG